MHLVTVRYRDATACCAGLASLLRIILGAKEPVAAVYGAYAKSYSLLTVNNEA